VVGGGSIKGGQVYGSSSKDGMDIKDNPTEVGSVFATIFKGMGLDPATQVRDNLSRPTFIAVDKNKKAAQPLKGLV